MLCRLQNGQCQLDKGEESYGIDSGDSLIILENQKYIYFFLLHLIISGRRDVQDVQDVQE